MQDVDSQGFVVLYRKIVKSEVWANADLLKVFLWCVLKANHEDNWIPVKTGRGETTIPIKRGQFLFGRKKAAKELRMKPSSVRDRMKKLKNMQNIDIKPDTHYSVVTVCNYDSYQNKKTSIQQATRQPTDNQPTTNRQPTDTNNKEYNLNNDNNVNHKKEKSIFNEARKLYQGTKRGNDTEFANFIKKTHDWKVVLPTLKTIIENHVEWHKENDCFWKNFQTWINNRCWEQELEIRKARYNDLHGSTATTNRQKQTVTDGSDIDWAALQAESKKTRDEKCASDMS